MLLESFVVGPLACNCTLVADSDTREALVVDPGGDAELITTFIAEKRLRVVGIVHTHAHIDHVGATAAVAAATHAPTYLHPADTFLYEILRQQAALIGARSCAPWNVDRALDDGDTLRFGKHEVRVIHTPGHSPGSVSLVFAQEKLCLSGDTLFAGGIGRTDLWGGDPRAIVHSIRHRLYTLASDTQVLPGHGPSTTIGRERDGNPFV